MRARIVHAPAQAGPREVVLAAVGWGAWGVIKGTELADPQCNRKREEHLETNPFRDIGNAASTGKSKGGKKKPRAPSGSL